MNSKTYLIKEKPAIFLSSSKIICKSQFLLKNDWEETKHIKRQGENICQYESLSRSCIGYHFRVQPHIMEAHLWLLGGHSCNNSYQIDNNWQNLVIYHLYEVKQRGGDLFADVKRCQHLVTLQTHGSCTYPWYEKLNSLVICIKHQYLKLRWSENLCITRSLLIQCTLFHAWQSSKHDTILDF